MFESNDIPFTLAELGITDQTVTILDLWSGKSLGDSTSTYTVKALPAYGNAALRFSKKATKEISQ